MQWAQRRVDAHHCRQRCVRGRRRATREGDRVHPVRVPRADVHVKIGAEGREQVEGSELAKSPCKSSGAISLVKRCRRSGTYVCGTGADLIGDDLVRVCIPLRLWFQCEPGLGVPREVVRPSEAVVLARTWLGVDLKFRVIPSGADFPPGYEA